MADQSKRARSRPDAAVAEFWLDLLEDPSWIVRRVETVTLVELEAYERSVSIDVDAAEVRKRLNAHQLDADRAVRLPLAIIPKGLLLDFDLHDSSGEPLPVLSRADDSKIAVAVMLAAIARSTHRPMSDIPTELIQFLGDQAFTFPDEDDPDRKASLGVALVRWREWLDHETVTRWMRALTEGFLIVTEMQLGSGRQIVKYSRLETDSDDDIELLRSPQSDRWYKPRRWPFYPQRPSHPVVVRAAGALRAESEHVRVVAPTGTFFASPAMLTAVPDTHEHLSIDYSSRIGGGRAVFNIRSDAKNPRHLPVVYFVGALLPDMHGFRVPVRIFMTLAALALLGGGLAEWRWGFLGRLSDALDPAVTILLLLPTLFLAYIVREGEHAARRRLLTILRGIALSSLLPLLAGALVLLIDSDLILDWVVASTWIIAGVIDAALAIWFWVLTGRIQGAARFVETAAAQTTEWTIEATADADSLR